MKGQEVEEWRIVIREGKERNTDGRVRVKVLAAAEGAARRRSNKVKKKGNNY